MSRRRAMDTIDKTPIAILSVLTVLGLVLIAYGTSQQPTNILLSRYSREYLGMINVFTLIGAVIFPASLLLLLVWIFTLPRKRKKELNNQAILAS